MRNELDRNILVISDLHLGEDLRPGAANVSYLRHLVRLERELESFLAHYTQHRIEGRPWQLVINGDMVDFMSVMILPGADASDEDAAAEDPEDKLYGLGFGERQSQKKLERVIARHQGVFGRLAEFIGAGNELVVVVGNHDVEFHYPSVQKTMVEWLCGLACGVGASDEARAEFARRIQFCPWFYYRENLIYIEHGHQYDEYCSFDYLLHPVRGGKKSRIALSVAHMGMRYFANQLPEYDPHTAESWGLWDYCRWAWAQGLRGAIRLCYFYGLLIWRLVELWYALVDRASDGERRAVHHQRLRALSRDYEIAEEKLLALDALRRVPVTKRFGRLLAALFIDRVLLGLAALAAGGVFIARLHGMARLWAPVATLVAAAVVNQLLNRARLVSPAQRLRSAPRFIRELIRAPLIVFGHSHAPERVALDGDGVYFNTGTWASDDERFAFTHLVVMPAEDAGSPRAELRQWREGASAPYIK
jgi:UDP-2,3-diacylglucosamine pyrophosphatase LpxH